MSERPGRGARPHKEEESHSSGAPAPPPTPPPHVTLVSADGVAFTAVPAPVARLARVLGPALEAGPASIPIPGVPARPLALALDFLSAQAALEAELAGWRGQRRGRSSPRSDDPAAAHAAWAAAWVAALPGPDVASLAAAASFLDSPTLLEMSISSLAARLRRARPPAQLRAEFGLPDDLTPAEVAAVQADCAGALDVGTW